MKPRISRKTRMGVSLMALVLLLLAGTATTNAQQKLKFTVASFELDQFDLTAKNEQYKKVDGNGSLYAIIKVTSTNPDDDLKAYNFNFGNMNSLVEQHDGELWVYVQRNAKMVTISRQGYTTINKYDLQTTIEEGRTYTMQLSSQGKVISMQMVLFQVTPADSKAVVMVKGSGPDAAETMLGTADASGQLAKNMELGTYTYKVVSENYYPSEGRFTLDDQSQTHHESVILRPRFSLITLTVASEADIYVNGERKGRRTWQGQLNAGNYQVECRQQNHRTTTQSISVEENKPQTFTLQAPTPITGTLSIISQPLGAAISIDGKDYGTTPKNITDMLIGSHQVKLSKAGYNDELLTATVKENEFSEVKVTLNNIPVVTTPEATDEKTFTVTGNGKTVTFKMKLVKAGTFQMGSATSNNDDEKPVHSVTLTKDYYMGETEVTQALWYAVMGQSPTSDGRKWESYDGLGDNYPAYCISYEDCQQFLTKLNQMTGQNFRFPTEAEWEFAAKGGTKSKGYTYAGSNAIDDVGWYKDDGMGTHVVARKKANELGLYDMSGNVWEWCYDGYGSYSSSAQTNPTGAVNVPERVIRGGGWECPGALCRTTYRLSGGLDGTQGLRLALTLNNIPVETTPEATDEKTFTVTGNGKTVTFKMKLVEAGTFQMGSMTGEDNEKPVHSVTLTKDYYMGETEVTQALWYAVTGKTIRQQALWYAVTEQQRDMAKKSYSLRGEGDDYPAYYVSYADCEQFLRELNQMTGQSFRFPTEAEWEYAASGGSKGMGYTYSGGNDIGDVAWYDGNSGGKTHAVKTKSPNELGLYDMSGNVWEWCQDWYGSYPSSAQTNPTGPSSGSDRVYRGGSWCSNATYCRTAYRYYYRPSLRFDLGLRLAL